MTETFRTCEGHRGITILIFGRLTMFANCLEEPYVCAHDDKLSQSIYQLRETADIYSQTMMDHPEHKLL
jgi:hypothetical protein